MERSKELANRLNEVLLNGRWIANTNYKRITVILCVLIGLVSCNSNVTGQENNEITIDGDTVLADSIMNITEAVSDSFPESTKLIIYPFQYIEMRNRYKTAIIPLTDSYRWSEHADSLVVEDKYLGMKKYENDNYHTLENEYRSRFLTRSGIDEDDHIFIYNVALDSIEIYKVKDIPLIAFVNLYGSQGAVRQQDYQIGFEIKSSNLYRSHQIGALAYVGKLNPFMSGGLTPISWTEIASEDLPMDKLNARDSIRVIRYRSSKTYLFENSGLEYKVQNLGTGSAIGTRHLVITSSSTNKVVYSSIYRGDSEGSYLISLNDVEKGHGYEEQPRQWTGNLFKNRPPVIFGFLGMSFWCPSIEFIDETEPRIVIRCDNRH